MEVLKANTQQYNELNGYKNGVHELGFQKDANNNWITGMQVLTLEPFLEIKPQLEQLEVITYNPVIVEI